MTIPKIIHQLWIGPKRAPIKMMESWKLKNPDYEYILWDDEEIKRRAMVFKCTDEIDLFQEINGKCDIMRWEILYKYGGIFIDADSFCIEPLDDFFLYHEQGFGTFENEIVRMGLVSTGTMGFQRHTQLCGDIIDWIYNEEIDVLLANPAWITVGPGCLTRFLNSGSYPLFTVYPSYLFLPIHHTEVIYEGHRKVYGHQAWCTSNISYDIVDKITIPQCLLVPKFNVSILIPSYNTKIEHVRECLDSILNQNGSFNIELVWCNDGSCLENTLLLEAELRRFEINSRFIDIKYLKTNKNKGLIECLSNGVKLCSNEYIFRMDSDDVMMSNRIQIQYTFMMNNPSVCVCGGNMVKFKNNGETSVLSHNLEIKWSDYIESVTKSGWIMNHPTLCFKKSAVMEVGNYDKHGIESMYMEDYDLELRLMKRFGSIINIPVDLVYYRDHDGQIGKLHKNMDHNKVFEKVSNII